MRRGVIAAIVLLSFASGGRGQETPPPDKKATAVPDMKELHAQFTKRLTDARLVGHFTVFGKEGAGKREEYVISSVKKLPEGDFWLFKSRIKYGDKDVTVPLPLEVKWAGDTPVITLTDFEIPGLGTFSARVMIYDDVYAGWWKHGEAGGHLYGRVEAIKAEEKE